MDNRGQRQREDIEHHKLIDPNKYNVHPLSRESPADFQPAVGPPAHLREGCRDLVARLRGPCGPITMDLVLALPRKRAARSPQPPRK